MVSEVPLWRMANNQNVLPFIPVLSHFQILHPQAITVGIFTRYLWRVDLVWLPDTPPATFSRLLPPLVGWGKNKLKKLVGRNKGREITYYIGKTDPTGGKSIYFIAV